MHPNCDAEYTVIASTVFPENAPPYFTYGIRAVCSLHGECEVQDLSLSLKQTAEFCAVLNANDCCCVHLLNVCEDFVAQ